MHANEMRQFSLTYSFPFKFFELLQFGTRELISEKNSFSEVLAKAKELDLFSISRLYLRSPSDGMHQFANILMSKLEAGDYKPYSIDKLINDYTFHKERYAEVETSAYWQNSPRFIDPGEMFHFLQAAIQKHVGPEVEIYSLSIAENRDEKYGVARIWEDFQHYICIDRKKNILQMITSGFD